MRGKIIEENSKFQTYWEFQRTTSE
jgi:hypothetical protein